MIEALEIQKSYGLKVKTKALDGFSYRFEEGRVYGVVGPSGSGKTTLLYVLSGIEVPDRGEVIFMGKGLFSINEKERRDIRKRYFGFVFQHFYLIPYLNAAENVMLGQYIKAGKTDKAEALKILESLGINDPYKKPYEYSGGEQQRIAIARALAGNPKVIFADEPTGNLDTENSKRVFSVLYDLAKDGRVVILATHDVENLKADVVIRLRDGKILETYQP
ncbi:MAG: ABC transporter ATP-binding protein [candidate division WOR-3 bacterium]